MPAIRPATGDSARARVFISMGESAHATVRPIVGWFLILVLAVAALWAAPARAGDMAERQILGFSRDGDYFAFEEYGIEDGSGFPYANIYVIDTVRNRWVRGSPFRVRITDESIPLRRARRRAKARAAAMLRRLGIAPRGRLLASNPVSELSADPHTVTVALNERYPPGPGATFRLSEYPLRAGDCARYTDLPTQGFRLSVRLSGGRRQLLHEDGRIPKSRGCPLNYAISDILRYRPPDGDDVYVVIISVFRHGFEGPDRRFIAGGYRLRRY